MEFLSIIISYFLFYLPCILGDNFKVFWNVPSQQCLVNYNINLVPLLQQYGIYVNKNDKFQGENVTIFYEKQLGFYPQILSNGTLENGGIPQLADIDKHLNKTVEDLQKIIPDKEFQGLGVIDWEAWRPVWEFNWDTLRIYQQQSIHLIKKLHPNLPEKDAQKLAERQWENSAKSWMLRTLGLARQLRPKGKWCYYLFPDCYNYEGNSAQEFQCSNNIKNGNDKLKWLWEASSAICPSLYLYESFMKKYTLKQRIWITNGKLNETLRVASVDAKIFPYISYSLTSKTVVPKKEFWRVLAQIASVGADGAVVWGSSASVGSKSLCQELQNYIINILGPATERIAWNSNLCSRNICNSHGRCTWPEDPNVTSWKLMTNKDNPDFYAGNITCKCFAGFDGRFCQNS